MSGGPIFPPDRSFKFDLDTPDVNPLPFVKGLFSLREQMAIYGDTTHHLRNLLKV